jgi:N-acetylmuramoyl-L-alanine amidase
MNLMLNCHAVRIGAGLLCALLLFSGCSSEQAAENNEENFVSTETALPGTGIRREKKKDKTSDDREKVKEGYVICVDPGHGFVDGGCGDGIWEDGTLEKDINLAVANKLKEDLTNLGFSVVMTHDGTTFGKTAEDNGDQIFNPSERVAYANTLDIDYYVSIHVNSYEANLDTCGIRIYYENENNWRKVDTNDEIIAQSIADSIENEMDPTPSPQIFDQSVASYQVTRETMVAASLIEIGFCTNPTDAANMVDDEWQSEIAQAIADGLYSYYTGLSEGENYA